MALAVYLSILAASTAVIGRFVQSILTDHGYGPTFDLSVMLAVGVASLYLAVQLTYMALVRLYKPTASGTFYGAECFSLLSAAAFLPPLLDIEIPWPVPALAQYELLILLTAFLAVHGAFKLISFFAAVSGEPAPRWPCLLWGGVAVLCVVTALGLGRQWMEGLEAVRPVVDADPEQITVADATMDGRLLHEGALLELDISENVGNPPALYFRWAPGPADVGAPAPETLHVHMLLVGDTREHIVQEVSLDGEGWVHVKTPRDSIPPGLRRCEVYWNAERLARWQRMLPVKPVITSARTVYSGPPGVYPTREAAQRPNVVVLFMDALGTRHLSALDYGRRTTPAMDQLAGAGWLFRNAYTPAAEAPGAVASMLTGATPLYHGHLAGQQGPLPEGFITAPLRFQQAGYATALFSEDAGAPAEATIAGGGLERGFEYIDSAYFAPPELADNASDDASDNPHASNSAVGSDRTLRALSEWIEAHEAVPFFVAARLTALTQAEDPGTPHDRIFGANAAPRPVDEYDSALRHLDGRINAFMQELRRLRLATDTRLVIAGTWGADFTPAGQGIAPTLTEEGLRTPLLIHDHRAERNVVSDRVSKVDLFPTLLALADLPLREGFEDASLLREDPHEDEVTSVKGLPLAVSLRTQDWRFNVETDWDFFEQPRPADADGPAILYGGATRGRDRWVRNRSPQNPRTTQRFRDQVLDMLLERAETMPAWWEMDNPL